MDVIYDLNVLQHMDTAELEQLAKYLNFVEVAAGEVIFSEGDKGHFMCFIISGTLEVIKDPNASERVVIAQIGKGRTLGEMSLFDAMPRSATAQAKTACLLLTLSDESLDKLSEQHPKTAVKVMRSVSRLLSLNLRRTSGQLADFLLHQDDE